MDKEELEKAAQRHADAVRRYEDRKLHCKDDFIAGVEFILNRLRKMQPTEAWKEIINLVENENISV